VLLVEESAIERAIATLIENEKTVAEGAGAASFAALLEHPERFSGKRVGILISGGNIDSRLLSTILMRGLGRDGRLARLRVIAPDQPSGLARITACMSDNGARVLEIRPDRFFSPSAKAPAFELLVETRDRAHAEALVGMLNSRGLEAGLIE
jgi:threonine dehydratase